MTCPKLWTQNFSSEFDSSLTMLRQLGFGLRLYSFILMIKGYWAIEATQVSTRKKSSMWVFFKVGFGMIPRNYRPTLADDDNSTAVLLVFWISSMLCTILYYRVLIILSTGSACVLQLLFFRSEWCFITTVFVSSLPKVPATAQKFRQPLLIFSSLLCLIIVPHQYWLTVLKGLALIMSQHWLMVYRLEWIPAAPPTIGNRDARGFSDAVQCAYYDLDTWSCWITSSQATLQITSSRTKIIAEKRNTKYDFISVMLVPLTNLLP